jgi:hypothetical protein
VKRVLPTVAGLLVVPVLFLMTAGPSLAARVGLPPSVDESFNTFWSAESPHEAASEVPDVLASGVTFDEAYARLKKGRTYSSSAPRGPVWMKHRLALGDYWYSVDVPQSYTPAKVYQVRIQLHGGVMGRDRSEVRGNGLIGGLEGVEQIYVLPTSWVDAPWWTNAQIENLRAIVDTVKRTYNVDENRIVLSGTSDGGTGVYYVSMRDITPYASYEPLIGSIGVLQNPTIGMTGLVYPQNMLNRPFFIVNGGKDRLYPTSSVEPYIFYLQKKGVEVMYHPHPEGEHNTRWWAEEKDAFETFVHDHARKPLPDKLTWQTDVNGLTDRAHWLIINKLTARPDPREPLDDLNIFSSPSDTDPDALPPLPLFPERKPSGRVDLVREGNTVVATTRGVAEFTLLLSPDQFDFTKPVRVVADGEALFEGTVERSLKTLMKWAAADNDRTMLFGAELTIALPR